VSHAELSPSSSDRWFACPGSVALCRDIPNPDSLFSREGSFAHSVAARCLIQNIDAETLIGVTNGEFTVDQEMAEHIQVYLDAVRITMRCDGGELLVEQEVKVNDLTWGTADAIVVAPPVLHVHDLKFGKGVFVDADGNSQLLIYALAALLDYERKGGDASQIERVELHITQPRINADKLWRSATVLTQFLMDDWRTQVHVAQERTRDPNAPLVTGEHCKFCPARHGCPKRREEALAGAVSVFTEGLEGPASKPPSLVNMTPAQLAVVLNAKEMLESWLKDARELAFNELNAGREIPGWKVVAKVGHRKWVNEDAAAKALSQMGVDPYEKSLLSPAKAEKQLAKAMRKGKAEDLIAQLAHKPISGSSLAPVSDPRPALRPGSVFTAIAE
jgi:hypothetical protein